VEKRECLSFGQLYCPILGITGKYYEIPHLRLNARDRRNTRQLWKAKFF
jgi:hypothetical protein